MKAEIVTTGTELLLGEIVDTNATYIARQLRDIGLNLYYKTTVGDNRQRLADVLRTGLTRSDVIIVTGGLGPTVDDITREAVADATARPLEQRPEIVRHLEQQFAQWGREVGENNLRQSYLPQGALMLPNPIGTAPGFIVETDQGRVICMPGVPREMKRMMADHVLPYLQEQLGVKKGVIVARILHTAGIGESAIDDEIGHLMTRGNPTVGLAAHMGRADIRVAAWAPTTTEAEALIAPVEAEIRAKLGHWIYGSDDDTLGSVVAGLLRSRGATLALIETNTRGQLRASFADPDQDVLVATLAAESLSTLALDLGSEAELTVSSEAAELAAQLFQAQCGADYVLALLGTTDPGQGFWTADRGSTWVGLATPAGVVSRHFKVGGIDEYTAQWLAVQSLNWLRRFLQKEPH